MNNYIYINQEIKDLIFDKMKEVHDINIGNISLDQEQEIIYKNIKIVSLMLKNIVENKIETKNIKEFMKQFREKYGITKKDMSDGILEELLTKNDFFDAIKNSSFN